VELRLIWANFRAIGAGFGSFLGDGIGVLMMRLGYAKKFGDFLMLWAEKRAFSPHTGRW
jgi:hypothetical protein